jgi:hypothetical protein
MALWNRMQAAMELIMEKCRWCSGPMQKIVNVQAGLLSAYVCDHCDTAECGGMNACEVCQNLKKD